jgi:hypothetical protein
MNRSTESAFWNLSAAEKAALSDDDMRGVCKLALMEAGVLDPIKPVLLPTDPPELQTEARYVPTHKGYSAIGIAFLTEEAAAKFVALDPLQIDKDYRTDTESTKPTEGLAFECRMVPTQASVETRRASLETAKSNSKANDAAQSAFAEARKKADKITDRLWTARNEALTRVHYLEGIKKTFADYYELAYCDETVARGFLAKVYSQSDIIEAIGEGTMRSPTTVDLGASS